MRRINFKGGLYFADQYIQIATFLPSDRIYGFGEHIHETLKVICMNFVVCAKKFQNFSTTSPNTKRGACGNRINEPNKQMTKTFRMKGP